MSRGPVGVSALVGGCFDYAQHDSRMSPRACRGVHQVKQCNGGIIRLHFVSLRMTGKRVVLTAFRMTGVMTHGGITKCPTIKLVIPNEREESLRVSALFVEILRLRLRSAQNDGELPPVICLI